MSGVLMRENTQGLILDAFAILQTRLTLSDPLYLLEVHKPQNKLSGYAEKLFLLPNKVSTKRRRNRKIQIKLALP